MSRSNYDKPFYVDVGTSIAAIRCASNHDPVCSINHHCWIDHNGWKSSIELLKKDCDRMNKEVELYAQSKAVDTKPTCDWSVKDALDFANTLANHGWTRDANADAASSCIYALCRMLEDIGNAAAMREALDDVMHLLPHMLQYMRVHWEDANAGGYYKKIESGVKAALSAPPRNCDRFANEIDAQIAFLNEVWLISVTRQSILERDKFENWTDEMKTRYAAWLTATANEEGTSDGK